MTTRALRLAVAHSLNEIRSFPEREARSFEVIQLPSRDRWIFVPDAADPDDGSDWLLPSWQSAEISGRWHRWEVAGGGGTVNNYTTNVTLIEADDAVLTAENKDAVTIKAGQPVATHSSGVGVVL